MSDGGNMAKVIEIIKPRTKVDKVKIIFSGVLLLVLTAHCFLSAIFYEYYNFSITESYSIAIVLLPIILLAGLYGYLITMTSFLITFIVVIITSSSYAYSLVIMMIVGLLISLFSQYYWFETKVKTFVAATLTLFMSSIFSSLCFVVMNDNKYSLTLFENTGTFFLRDAPVVYIICLFLHLFLTMVPDKIKSIFPLGIGYTEQFKNNEEAKENVKKSKVSIKITAIIIALELCLGLAGSFFNYVLYPELKDIIIRNMDERANIERNFEDGERPEKPTDLEINNIKDSEYILNAESMTYDLKMIFLMMCVGVPFAAIINFYISTTIGANLGIISKYMTSFVNAEDDDKMLIAKRVDDIVIKSGDEIEIVYECMSDMVHEIEAYTGRVIEEQQLQADLAVAQKASEAKSSFLSNMSHEIRTPINAVLGMNEMILRESKEEQTLGYALEVKNASNNLLRIVNDILDFSKIEAGKMELIPVEYDLASVINDLINMIKKRAEDKGLAIRVNVSPNIPHLLFGDEIRIKQVVTNILTNAVKYTEEGGVVITVKLLECNEDDFKSLEDSLGEDINTNIRCENNQPVKLRFIVEDTGIGIKAEDMGRLFASFERVDEARNRTIEGTGLGMSITTNLLKMMGSELKVESEYGIGSIFYFDIIQNVVDDTPIGDFSEAIQSYAKTMEEYKESFIAPEAYILVVDDTEMNLTVINNLLKKTEVNIETAISGSECLEMIKIRKYDMIFLDHRMPEMDGIECLQHIKEDPDGLNYDTPIIALTANAVSGSREMYLDAGFDNYLTKPINAMVLEKMIADYLPPELVTIRTEEADNADEQELPEWMNKLPFVDVEKGIENCGGSEAYNTALHAYLDAVDDMQDSIKKAFLDNRISDYTIKVHALKSSSRIIGAEVIGALAEELEKAGNEGDMEVINACTDELLSYHKALGYSMKKYMLDKEDDIDKPTITPEKIKEAYCALKEIAQLFDYDSAQAIIESMDNYKFPESELEKYKKIKKAVNNTDWDTLNHLMEG